MRNYTLKQLQTFIEVAREKSVSRAAERLFVTQPAVSMQIRQLEDAFGLALIEPVGRNIQLTQAGHEFLARAIAAMGKLKDLEASMAEHVGAQRGRIELGIVSTAKYFVPMLLVQFRKLMPGIEVVLRIDNRENILGMLARNELDLVVMGRTPAHMDCEAVAFATNPLSIIAPPDHPLVRRKRMGVEALRDALFVVREPGSGTRASMERFFAEHRVPFRMVMEMPSNETIKQAVMAGMGLAYLSLRTVRHELAGGHIAQLDVVGMPIVGHWYVTHLRPKKLSPAAQSFKRFLIDQAEPLIDGWA